MNVLYRPRPPLLTSEPLIVNDRVKVMGDYTIYKDRRVN